MEKNLNLAIPQKLEGFFGREDELFFEECSQILQEKNFITENLISFLLPCQTANYLRSQW